VEGGEKIVVGVNKFAEDDALKTDVFPIDEAQQRAQVDRVRVLKSTRDNDAVRVALDDVRTAARGSANLLYPMKIALSRLATLGEVADVLRDEFGVYRAS
jgi:methylmalonyl-CoA mutase N-terminal domain/subunit